MLPSPTNCKSSSVIFFLLFFFQIIIVNRMVLCRWLCCLFDYILFSYTYIQRSVFVVHVSRIISQTLSYDSYDTNNQIYICTCIYVRLYLYNVFIYTCTYITYTFMVYNILYTWLKINSVHSVAVTLLLYPIYFPSIWWRMCDAVPPSLIYKSRWLCEALHRLCAHTYTHNCMLFSSLHSLYTCIRIQTNEYAYSDRRLRKYLLLLFFFRILSSICMRMCM